MGLNKWLKNVNYQSKKKETKKKTLLQLLLGNLDFHIKN